MVNARALAEGLVRRGAELVTGGTDNHLVLIDVAASFGLTGRQAEAALLDAGVVTNRNSVPGDANGAWYTSGIRLGTPALTTLGFGADELDEVADVLVKCATSHDPATSTAKAKYEIDPEVAQACRARCADLLAHHPLYPEIEPVNRHASVRRRSRGLNSMRQGLTSDSVAVRMCPICPARRRIAAEEPEPGHKVSRSANSKSPRGRPCHRFGADPRVHSGRCGSPRPQ